MSCCWLGRECSALQKGAGLLLDAIKRVVAIAFMSVSVVCTDPNELAAVLYNIHRCVLPMVEQISKIPGRFNHLKHLLTNALGCINALQIIADVNYFFNYKPQSDAKLQLAGTIANCAADARLTFFWLEKLGFYSIASLSKACGKSYAIKIADALTIRALGVSYALFAANAFFSFQTAKNHPLRVQAGFECAKNFAEFSLDILMATSICGVVAFGAAGMICIAIRVACLLNNGFTHCGMAYKVI